MKKSFKIARLAAFVFAGMTAAFLSPLQAIGEGIDFIPRVEDVAGTLELNMGQRDIKTTSGETSYKSSIERMRLDAVGYVYHPRFILFRVSGAAGLEQDSYTTNGGYRRTSKSFDEYDAVVTLLPEHPYNLELFTRRRIAAVSSTSSERSISSSEGAIFRYRQRPISLYLSAVTESFEMFELTDSKQYTARGSYLIGPFRNEAGYYQRETRSSQGTQADRTNSYFNNDLKLNAFKLGSAVKTDQLLQSNPAEASIKMDSFSWSENLIMDLPLNFSAGFSHNYQKDVITTGQTPSSPESTTFSKTNGEGVEITHRLYSSLRTSYRASQSSSQTTGGDTASSTQSIAVAYQKRIPTGSLSTGYSFQNQSSTRTGAAAITNETHTAAVPGAFTLNNQAVDQSTVIVMVKDPTTQNLVPLTINVNYQILQFGNTLQISLLNLPTSINPPAASYDFLVTYSLLSNDSKMETTTNSFNLAFALFEGLFNPYFIYTTSDQEIVSGTFFSGPDATTTRIYGYSVQKNPFLLFFAYTDYQSRLSSYRSLRASTEYRQFLHEDVDVTARLSYNEIVRPPTGTSGAYSEKTTSMEAILHKVFPSENLNIFAGGSYTVREVTGATSQSYAFNPSLKWHVGKLDVSATLSRTYTVTDVTNGKQTREEDAYFLTMSRRIF